VEQIVLEGRAITKTVQKLSASSSTRRSITMSRRTHHWILSWVGRILFWPSRHT